MSSIVIGIYLALMIMTVSPAGLSPEETQRPETIVIAHRKIETMKWGRLSPEQSENPDLLTIAQKIMEETQEEPILYENWKSQEERTRFIRVALAFTGTPYKSGGITASGMDCSGLTYLTYRLFGISLPRTVAKQYLVGRRVERSELEEGDLVFFDGTGKPMHVGIYLGDGKFVHASSAAKQIRTDFLDTPWQYKRFIAAVRIRELRNNRETR